MNFESKRNRELLNKTMKQKKYIDVLWREIGVVCGNFRTERETRFSEGRAHRSEMVKLTAKLNIANLQIKTLTTQLEVLYESIPFHATGKASAGDITKARHDTWLIIDEAKQHEHKVYRVDACDGDGLGDQRHHKTSEDGDRRIALKEAYGDD